MVLTGRSMARSLTPAAIVETQRAAFIAAAAGHIETPERCRLGALHGEVVIMPAAEASAGHLAVKILTGYPENPSQGRPANQAVVILIDLDSGSVRAVLDGTWITAARTGAAAALALDVAGPRATHTLTILGSGPVADWAIRCCLAVRRPEEVRIWSRSADRAAALARRVRRHARRGLRVRVAPDATAAVSGADGVVTATNADRALFPADALSTSAHVSAMGGAEPGWELDPDLLDQAHLIVDSPASWDEASDIAQARARAGRDPLQLGALCTDASPLGIGGRRPTIFRAVGVAFQDLALAVAALERRDRSFS